MNEKQVKLAACKHFISSLFKMLCWREEKKRWETIYDEIIKEVVYSGFLTDGEKGDLLVKLTPLKYVDFSNFRQTIFEVINYVDTISRV